MFHSFLILQTLRPDTSCVSATSNTATLTGVRGSNPVTSALKTRHEPDLSAPHPHGDLSLNNLSSPDGLHKTKQRWAPRSPPWVLPIHAAPPLLGMGSPPSLSPGQLCAALLDPCPSGPCLACALCVEGSSPSHRAHPYSRQAPTSQFSRVWVLSPGRVSPHGQRICFASLLVPVPASVPNNSRCSVTI